MSRIAVSLSLLWALALSSPASGQCGTGDGILDMPDLAPIGSLITVNVDAPPPATAAALFFSLGQGPVDFGTYGTICLDFPALVGIVLLLDGNGHAEIQAEVPCEPATVGIPVYGQFLVCSPGVGAQSHGSSNQDVTTIDEGVGLGSFCTHTQLGWGSDCVVHPAGCLLVDHFLDVFPDGVLLGDQDGNDTDSFFASLYTTIGAIQHYLPQTLGPALLVRDWLNPECAAGFCLGGDLLAAKLNVGFDDAGLFDDAKCRDDVKLGDLVFVGCVDEDLIGLTVRELIAIADLAISGELGPGPFDIDGDSTNDLTLFELKDALQAVNENFEDCLANEGCLQIP
jgi:hypothetical protein